MPTDVNVRILGDRGSSSADEWEAEADAPPKGPLGRSRGRVDHRSGTRPLLWSKGRLTLNDEPVPGPEYAVTAEGKRLRLSFPLENLGHPRSFLIGVELRRGGITFAKSAYRLIELTSSPALQRSR